MTKPNFGMRNAVLGVAALVLLALPIAAQQSGLSEIGSSQAGSSQAAAAQPALLNGVGISQEMNRQVPAGLTFRDETGKTVHLADYFGKRPIVLSLVYLNCPYMCTEVLNGELRALQGMSLTLGKDYDAISVSFDPKDGPKEAALKSRIYTGMYERPSAPGQWHFLTGDQQSITALTDSVGFHYAYDSPSGQYAHATAMMILTPQGRVARYYYGVQYPARDVRLGLVEASEGKIGTPTDAALLFCYHYDPETGKYGLVIANVLKIAGALTILLLGAFLWFMFRAEKIRHEAAQVRLP